MGGMWTRRWGFWDLEHRPRCLTPGFQLQWDRGEPGLMGACAETPPAPCHILFGRASVSSRLWV